MSKPVLYHERYYTGSRDDLLEKVQAAMSPKRFAHVLRVEEMALRLADQYGLMPEQVSVAALTHDYAKERPDADFIAAIAQYQLDPALLPWGNNVWHGVVGAELVQAELEIHDQTILDAIRQHTIGGAYMTTLSQVIYMADYIEMGRDFPGVTEVRDLAFTDLAASVGWQARQTLQYLVAQQHQIYPGSLVTYNVWSTKQ